MRLTPGQPAPALQTQDFLGAPVSLAALRGRPVLLSFYRYASCPICNFRVRELMLAHPALAASGLAVIGVFQSPAVAMAQHVGRQDAPFPLVADPGMALYRRFGVERGWTALLRPATLRSAWLAMRAGFAPGGIDGPVDRLPADFLIAPDGRIARSHYGQDLGDHLPLAEVQAWLDAGSAGA